MTIYYQVLRMREISIVSGNRHKVDELMPLAKAHGIRLKWINYSKVEIQADGISDIARAGGILAYAALGVPLIVEDTGIFISALKGFPGPYSAQAYKTIGLEGILTLLKGRKSRKAEFRTAICYAGDEDTVVFEGVVHGTIATRIRGGRDFGYDPIFIPEGHTKAYSEMELAEKNSASHRAAAFEKFAEYLSRK